MKNNTQAYDSILITCPGHFFNRTYKDLVKEWLECDGNSGIWIYKMAKLPKQRRIINAFIIVRGRIRWRCLISEMEEYGDIVLDSGKSISAPYISIFDFQPIPKALQIPHKGFQGFRYFDSESATTFSKPWP